MSERRRGLGRGLGALIPTDPRAGEADDERLPGRGRPLDRLGAGPSPRPGPAPAGGAAPSVVDLRGHDDSGDVDRGRDGRGHDGTAGDDSPAGASHEASTPVGTPAVLRRPPDLVPVPGVRFAEVPIGAITPNPRQPRLDFDVDALGELALSIREVGVLQPVVLRPLAGADGAADAAVDDGADATAYELVMGERRWRAAEMAGLETVPALVRNTSDDSLLRDALLENLHRVQLNPLEEGAAYQQLLDDFGCTHDQLAQRLGRSRPQISNTIRLLRLPPAVQRRVAAGVLSAGHARALLGLSDPSAMERLAQRIVAEGLSVRATEEVVALGGEGTAPRRPARRGGSSSGGQAFVDLAERLSDRFDTRVSVAMGQSKGRLTVEFAGVEDLNRILERLAPEDPGLGETLPG